MKLKIFVIVFLATFVFGATSVVYAQESEENVNYGLEGSAFKAGYVKDAKGGKRGEALANLLPLIGQVIGIALSMIGVALFGLFLYAGIRWLIARGNQEDITKSKDIMEAAIIGMIIILGAWGLSSWVLKNLGVGGGSSGGHGEVGCMPKYTDNMTDAAKLAVQEATCGDKNKEQCVADGAHCDWREARETSVEIAGECKGGGTAPEQFCDSFCKLNGDQDIEGVCDVACDIIDPDRGAPIGLERFTMNQLCAESDTQFACDFYAPHCFWQPD